MNNPTPDNMRAVLLTGYGGFDKLDYRDDIPVPIPGPDEVLIRVGAAGINNTDINTRIGWYSKEVTADTHQDWTDAELASIPCAYSTAENMLHRAKLSSGERVLITGASGGVGSAAVQLAKRRGAQIVAVAGKTKAEAVRSLGA